MYTVYCELLHHTDRISSPDEESKGSLQLLLTKMNRCRCSYIMFYASLTIQVFIWELAF